MRKHVILTAILTFVLLSVVTLHWGSVVAEQVAGKKPVVSIADRVVYYLEDGFLVKSQVCPNGQDGSPTPTGTSTVYGHSFECFTGRVYRYYTKWFCGKYTVHSILLNRNTGTWIGGDSLGHKASSGCVRHSLEDARWACEWTPDGTPPHVIQDHFESPPASGFAWGDSVPCGATAPARAFYFAEGTCRPWFDPYLCIQNPGSGESTPRTTCMMGDDTNREQAVSVGARSRCTVAVKQFLGEADAPLHDFSCKVESNSGGSIVVERLMYSRYGTRWTLDARAWSRRSRQIDSRAGWIWVEGKDPVQRRRCSCRQADMSRGGLPRAGNYWKVSVQS